jgi:glutathione S-transferase
VSDELVLYQYGGRGKLPSLSPPCLKVDLALKILGVPHRVVDLDSPGAVKRHSPTGRVPALEYQGKKIAESILVMDRLEELFPDGRLWASGAAGRARDRVWDCFATDTLYWLGFYQRWLVPTIREGMLNRFLGEGFSLKKLGMRLYAKTVLRKRAVGQGVGLRPAREVRDAYLRSLDTIQDGLEGGPFLGGRKEPGRGDVAVAAHVAQLTFARHLPPILALIKERGDLFEHLGAVFEAAGLEAP